jgi:hypothetical protein
MIHASNITGTGLASHSTCSSKFTGLYSLHYGNRSSCCLFNKPLITPAAFYPNAEASKSQIIKDNKGKSGVYLIFFC